MNELILGMLVLLGILVIFKFLLYIKKENDFTFLDLIAFIISALMALAIFLTVSFFIGFFIKSTFN